MVWCHEMRKYWDEKRQERRRCKKEIDFIDTETSQEKRVQLRHNRGREHVSRIQKEKEKRYFSPHRMTLRSNSVICQPHRQHGWLMDWEGTRNTSSGNPSVVICSRHYQTYLQRELADNRADTRNGTAARADGEHGQ